MWSFVRDIGNSRLVGWGIVLSVFIVIIRKTKLLVFGALFFKIYIDTHHLAGNLLILNDGTVNILSVTVLDNCEIYLNLLRIYHNSWY